MEKEKLQEYWDAVLIKKFRQGQTILDAVQMWERLTGCAFLDHAESLLRTPRVGFPWAVQVTAFCDQFLPKIADRLWNQHTSKDVLLLKKLQTSSYTTLKSQLRRDAQIDSVSQQIKKNHAAIELETRNYGIRNKKTDWNITK